MQDNFDTRMHSSSLRTVRSSRRRVGGVCPWRGVSARWVSAQGRESAHGVSARGVSAPVHAGIHSPPPREQNHRCL